MASMFCEHGYLRDCPICGHHVDGFPAIRGETVARGRRYIENAVKPENRDIDVAEIRRPDGTREKCFCSPGLPEEYNGDTTYQWCASYQENERKAKEQGCEVAG